MNRYHHRKKANVTFWRSVAFIFIGMSISLVAGMWSMSNRVDPAKLVYQVCNESRISLSINERGCGDLQDQLHMEFVCEHNNTDPDNHCQVEEK